MTFSINEIRSELVHGGWRPSHFNVMITNPYDTAADSKLTFMVRAAQLPSFNIGKIAVYYFGRPIFVPGDRNFEDWTTTVINDEDFKIKNALEKWHGKMNSLQGNISSTNLVNELKSVASITAYGKDGRTLRTYQMDGIFPTNIAAIDADWQTTDVVSEFQVTWSFDDCYVTGGETGTGGDL